MVDYTNALKRPFQDTGILAIGIILSIIPIVNFLTSGYILGVINATLKKDYGMPIWDDWGNLFVKGLIMNIMSMVYMLPGILVIFVGAGGAIGAFMVNPASVISMIAGAGIFILFGVLLILIGMFLMPIAVIEYAKSGEINAFFNFGAIKEKAFRMNYAVTFTVMVMITTLVVMVMSMIPLIGPMLGTPAAMFIMNVANYTAFTEAYKE